MADNLTTTTTVSTVPDGTVIATDDVSSVHFQKVKIDVGADGASALLGNANPLPVSDAGSTLSVDDGGSTVSIDDGAGSLTVDNNGTFAVQATLQASTNTTEVVGDAAHDAAVAGNPVLVGGYASAAAPSDVSGDGDVARIWTTVKGAVNVADAGGSLTVDVGTALPAGTNAIGKLAANSGVDIGDVDITSIAAGDNNIGNVDIASIAAGNNNIGDVDVASIVPGTGATNLGKAEDAAHSSGDVGVMMLAVRQDAHADLGADGDYIPPTIDADGGLRVSIVAGSSAGTQYTEGDTDASITGTAILWEDGSDTLRAASSAKPLPVQIIDSATIGTSTAVTSIVPGTAATNLGKAEDAAHSSGDVGVMMLAVRQDSHSDLGADGDYIPPTIDADGGLRVSVVAGGGTGGTAAADDADFTDGTTPGTPVMGVYESTPSTVTDGDLGVAGITETRSLKVHVSGFTAGDVNLGNVDVVSSALPTGASTLAEQQTQTTHLATIAGDTTDIEAAVELIDDTIFADDAAYTAATSKLMVVGGQYQSTPNALDDNDAGSILLDANHAVQAVLRAGTAAIGKLAANSGVDIGDVDITSIAAGDNNIGNVDIVSLPALAAGTAEIGSLLPPDTDVTAHTNYAKKYYTNAGAVTDGIVWSPAAGKRYHVVSMFINTSAAATVTFEDDKAGGDEAIMKMELAANSGMTINFGEQYPLASGEDAADLIVTTSAGNIYITCTGYEI